VDSVFVGMKGQSESRKERSDDGFISGRFFERLEESSEGVLFNRKE